MIQQLNPNATLNELAKACSPWINTRDPQITAEEIAQEQWQDIPSLPGYEASTLGRVRGHRLLHQSYRGTTTLYPAVCADGRLRYTHRLVAEAFMGHAGGYEVDHIDGNSFNNRAENLEYVTRRENNHRAKDRLAAKRLGRAPWMAIYDAALSAQTIALQPGGCTRGHTAEEFGTRRDGTCRACKSATINIQHDITRELMQPWYGQWQGIMVGVTPAPEPDEDDLCDVVPITGYAFRKVA